jgi:lipopolysaccharide/colanic/teichoic acid biosynthesis glycosyltransferase
MRHLPAKLTEELRYVEEQSMILDLKVIMQTISCVALRPWLLPPKKQPLPLGEEYV